MSKKLLADIAQQGDTLETLRALRQTIAEAIDRTTGGRDIASLSLQMQKVLDRIAEMEALDDENDPIAAIIREQGISPARFRRAQRLNEDLLEDEEE